MPYHDPDPADPTILIGVEAPASPASDTEMAYVFAEEFARMGFSEKRLLALFHSPFYAGAYRALRTLGEEKIRAIIGETLDIWGRFHHGVEDAPENEQWDEGNHESDL
ncbi:MAG: hypothetical protein HY238_05950 [Acidobacteria bacterium]|nr:hypothetical protein [Acidobacteriota bacterium]